MSEAPANEVRIAGSLAERGALRYTPAGQCVLDLKIRHESQRSEAGLRRRVECEIEAVAVGMPGQMIAGAPLGTRMELKGFLAARSARSRRPVLHVTEIEFAEESRDGIQTENGQTRPEA